MDLNNWVPVATNSPSEITRDISLGADPNQVAFYRAWRNPLPTFPGALVARSNITLIGTSILIDSYDSGDTNFSTPGGLFDPAKRKAGNDVSSAEGFIDVGNADLKGKLFTGPLNSFTVGPYGSVGDLNWVGPGVQPGWYSNNFRYALPDISPPFPTGLPPMGDVTNLWCLGSAAYMYEGNFSATPTATIRVSTSTKT